MRAIILVAGKGTRLRPLTESAPKCFTEVGGIPILLNALDHLAECGVREVTLVIGYLGEAVRARVGERFREMTVSYAENEIFDRTNTSFSLWRALEGREADGDLLLLEGDVFFERELLRRFLEDAPSEATVVERHRPGLDGSFVTLESERVTDWIHTSQRDDDFSFDDKFKTVNIHKFGSDFVGGTLRPVLRSHVEAADGREPLEMVMRDIVRNHDTPVHAFQSGALKWFEIDDVADLQVAEELFADPS